MAKGIGPTIGERIVTLRGKRLTQTALAARAGVSVDLIRKLEQGVRHTLSIRSLHKIARVLDVDPAQLLAKTISLPGEVENSGVVAIREALTRVDHLIDDEPPVEALTLVKARRGISYGWGCYWAGRLDELGRLLPDLITQMLATVRGASDVERGEAHDLAAQLYQLTVCTLVQLGYPDIAHLAIRDALRLAEFGSDPLRPAVLRCTLAWLLLTQGRSVEAHRLATATAAAVAPRGDSPLPFWSVYGSLLLTGATAYGRAGDRPGARVLLDEARDAASRTGNRNDYESAFGPDQVLMQTVDVELVTENYVDALSVGARMRPDAALPPAARARHLSDVAMAHTRLGHDGRAFDALVAMRNIAPSWMRYQSQPKEIVRELRERSCPPVLREMAQQLGVLET